MLYQRINYWKDTLTSLDACRANLDRALKLAEFRRSGLNDGNIARIMWKKGVILCDSVYASPNENRIGEELKSEATFMRRDILVEQGLTHELAEQTASDLVEASFDNLVSGFFR
jgi:hypothetical protein